MSDQILLNPGDEFEKFTVEKELGHGGMGAVYLVRHKVLGTEFALKVLYPEVAKRDRKFVERFIREARLAGGIRHQNLIAVYDAGLNEQSGMYYLVMDFVEGGSVRELLKRDGYVDMVEAISIVRQVASALEAAQQRNMVHRDIKPDNIMFDSHGVVRLADLGIAKSTDERGDNLTVEASVFGTPSYMSPEQARDASKVDTRADIYSLGVVLFEMLTGRRPFGGENSIEILSHVIGPEESPDVREYSPDVPENVAKLVADMLAKDIKKRIASPTALIKRIDSIDLSEYGGDASIASMQETEDEQDVTLQTLPDVQAAAKATAAEEEQDVTLETLPDVQAAVSAPATSSNSAASAAASAPAAEEEQDVTLQTLPDVAATAAAKATAAEEELDVTLQTLPDVQAAESASAASSNSAASAAAIAPAAEEELDVTLQTLPDVTSAISSASSDGSKPAASMPSVPAAKHADEEQRTMANVGHQKAELPAGQVRALKSFRLVLFGGLAALLLVVLLVGFFLIGKLKNKGGNGTSGENVNTSLMTETMEPVKPTPQNTAESVKPAPQNIDTKTVADKANTTAGVSTEVSFDNTVKRDSAIVAKGTATAGAEAVVSTPTVENTEPVVVRPVIPDVTESEAEELKSLGEIAEGGVVLFGADSAALVSLYKYLDANGGFAGVAYQEASGDVNQWCEQLAEIQGGSPAFVVVVVSREKNTLQFRRALEGMVKMLPATNAAIFVNTGDAGVYDEITHACTPVGMYVRKWASNKELTTYLQELQQELGW